MAPKKMLRLTGAKLSSVMEEQEEKPKIEPKEEKPEPETKVEVKAEKPRTRSSLMETGGGNQEAGSSTTPAQAGEENNFPAELVNLERRLGSQGYSTRRVLKNGNWGVEVGEQQGAARLEPERTKADGASMERMLGRLNLNEAWQRDQEKEDQNDDEVFDPVFLERDVSAPIKDVEADEAVSPPLGTPAQQFMSFQGVMQAAQNEVNTQARQAMGSIARNLREVEGRSLRCLEREIALQRRETALAKREEEVRDREMEARRNLMAGEAWRGFGGVKGQHRAAKSRGQAFQFPEIPAPQQQNTPSVVRFVNKKGKVERQVKTPDFSIIELLSWTVGLLSCLSVFRVGNQRTDGLSLSPSCLLLL